jgi:predicted CXXCH cytochrome family protein
MSYLKTCLVLLIILFFSAKYDSFAGIAGSLHDFSGNSWGSTQLCVYCHTPHNAKQTGSPAATIYPLWNHAPTNTSFTVYNSITLKATIGQPSGQSKLCLSCHDGSVAIDSYGTRTGSEMMTGKPNLGTDLSDDHPISFTYDAALISLNGALNPLSSAFGTKTIADYLYDGKVECGTCHEPHNATNGKFLRIANTASALCLTCHNK